MEFVNQKTAIKSLKAFSNMTVTKDIHYNILIISPAGWGKTSLAKLYMEKFDKKYIDILGSRFNPTSYSLENDQFIFIDEIHHLKPIENIYPYMDSPNNTTVFCTTDYARLPEPFMTRCNIIRLEEYTLEDITTIISEYSRYLGFPINNDTAELIAKRSRNNPRISKVLLMRAYGMMKTFTYEDSIDGFENVFDEIGVYDGGLTKEDLAYIDIVKTHGPISLRNISKTIRVDELTITEVMEPWMIKNRIIEVTSRGRQFISNPFEEDN